MSLPRVPFALLTFLLLVGCQAAMTRPMTATAATSAPTTTLLGSQSNDGLNAVVWQQTSVEYRLIAGQTWRSALFQLDRAIKAPAWDALSTEDRLTPIKGLPMAVIVDVDETVLDNSAYQARLVLENTSFSEDSYRIWAAEQAARPIPGALEFVRAATARGVTIFYISNRAADLTADTLANLRKVGFPIKDDSQFLNLATVVEGCELMATDKGCRRRWVGKNYRVLLQVGDQLGDLVSISQNTPEGREQAVRPYLGWVGERWFVLPNPLYGSWEPALFDNQWTLPEAERRQRKLDALRH